MKMLQFLLIFLEELSAYTGTVSLSGSEAMTSDTEQVVVWYSVDGITSTAEFLLSRIGMDTYSIGGVCKGYMAPTTPASASDLRDEIVEFLEVSLEGVPKSADHKAHYLCYITWIQGTLLWLKKHGIMLKSSGLELVDHTLGGKDDIGLAFRVNFHHYLWGYVYVVESGLSNVSCGTRTLNVRMICNGLPSKSTDFVQEYAIERGYVPSLDFIEQFLDDAIEKFK